MVTSSKAKQVILPITIIAFYCLLAYGIYFAYLGFYWDDWAIIYWHHIGGLQGLLSSTANDRPIIAYMHYAIFNSIGYNPLFYHIFTPFLWFMCCATTYLTLRLVWPDKVWYLLIICLLMSVYPGLSIHFTSVVAYPIFFGFLINICSIYFSLRFITEKIFIKKIIFCATSILLSIIGWAIYELIFFMEGLRLLLIAVFAYNYPGKSKLFSISKLILLMLPWLFTQCIYLTWRIFAYKGFRQITDHVSVDLSDQFVIIYRTFISFVNSTLFVWVYPVLSRIMADTPLHIIISLCVALIGCITWLFANYILMPPDFSQKPKDYMELLFASCWPAIIITFIFSGIALYTIKGGLQLGYPEPQILGLAPLSLAIIIGITLRKRNKSLERWQYQMVLIGCLSIIISMILVNIVNKTPNLDNLRDRWNIPSIIGVCVFICGSISLIKHRVVKLITICFMLSSGLIYHYLNAHQYYLDWQYQRNFVWQLWERAPYIKPGTILVLDPGIMRYRSTLAYYSIFGLTSTAYGRNIIQDQLGQARLGREKDEYILQKLHEAKTSQQGTRAITFPVDWSRPLVMSMEKHDRCLHIIDGSDPVFPPNSKPFFKQIGKYSRLDNITSVRGPKPPEKIFGKQPRNWCYYYQKSQLARQFSNWHKIVEIHKEATTNNMSTRIAMELLPFVQGFKYSGNTIMANKLARNIMQEHSAYKSASGLINNNR